MARLKHAPSVYQPIRVEDLRQAETEILKVVDQEAFEEEIKILCTRVNDSRSHRQELSRPKMVSKRLQHTSST